MRPAPRRADEAARLRAVDALAVLAPEGLAVLEQVPALVARLLGAGSSAVTLLTSAQQRDLVRVGGPAGVLPWDRSLCAHAVAAGGPLLVPDLQADPRFADDPDLAAAGLRAYAGVPLLGAHGLPVGTLCAVWREPRTLDAEEKSLLVMLAGWAERELLAAAHAEDAARARAEERRLREALDGAPAGVLVVDEDLVVQWSSRPAQRLFDLAGSAAGRPLVDLLPTFQRTDLGAAGRSRDGDVAVGAGRRFVQPARRREGDRFPAELTVSPLRDGRSVVFVRDLHDDRSERVRLAVLRKRTEVVLDALAEGVLVVHPSGQVAYGNLALSRMVQRRRLDLPGQDWHALLHGAPCQDDACPLGEPMDLVDRRLGPLHLHRPDGTSLAVEVHTRLAHEGDDDEAGVVLTLQDLTERLKVDRMKDEFLASVSHELRTPLTSIRGSLGLLASGAVPIDGPRAARMLQIAHESTERLSRLVNDILDLERLHAGRVELHPARHRVETLLSSSAAAVSGAATAGGVLVDVQCEDLSMVADADRIVQVLVNLLGNAVKFSPTGSVVRLTGTRGHGTVRLSVADQGRGIPAEDLERVFDRFAQVDASDARTGSGTGLGLAIARALTEQHGGTLTATSTVGQGSTFTLELPADDDTPRMLVYAPATSAPAELAASLRDLGYAVTPWAGTSPADAVERPAGVLLAETADHTALRALRAEVARAGLPLLVLSRLPGGPVLQHADAPAASVEGTVVVVEDDPDLAEVLTAALEHRGLRAVVATTARGAIDAVVQHRPDLLVLDLLLEEGTGFDVVDELRRRALPAPAAVLVYTALDLDEEQRRALRQQEQTVFLRKGEALVADVTASAVALLEAARAQAAPAPPHAVDAATGSDADPSTDTDTDTAPDPDLLRSRP